MGYLPYYCFRTKFQPVLAIIRIKPDVVCVEYVQVNPSLENLDSQLRRQQVDVQRCIFPILTSFFPPVSLIRLEY